MTTATNRDHVLDHAEGEWTPVRYGKSYRSRPHPRRCPSNLVANLRAGPSRTVPEIAAEYRGIYSWWKDSPCCAALRGLMAANARRSPPISRALCLGIGTFDPLDGGWEAKRRTFLQLIAFLVMVEELEKFSGRKIQCLFQEPIFSDSDKDFISSLGHESVDSPEACHRLTKDSLFFGVHLYRSVYSLALKSTLPAIFVGTGWRVWHETSLSEPHDLSGMEILERTYTRFEFPQDSCSTAFSSTSLYWRPCPADSAGTPDEEEHLASSFISLAVT